MPSDIYARNTLLKEQLDALIDLKTTAEKIDVVVTPHEVNGHHGTGPLLHRLFRGRKNIFSIRSRSDWRGMQDFGDANIRVFHAGRSRAESFQTVTRILAGRDVRTVLCSPYLTDDVITGIVVKEAFGARMCAYIMDDQNVTVPGIPDPLMREFLEKCSLRLA